MQTVKPITPDELVSAHQRRIPDFVIEAFNAAISANWRGKFAVVLQNDVLNAIVDHMLVSAGEEISRESEAYYEARAKVLSEHWLDVEPIFEAAGWHVEYDKPSYYETYVASFTFRKK